jgi:hypothetical protein
VPELLTNWANIIGLNTSSSSVINLKITLLLLLLLLLLLFREFEEYGIGIHGSEVNGRCL